MNFICILHKKPRISAFSIVIDEAETFDVRLLCTSYLKPLHPTPFGLEWGIHFFCKWK